MANMKDEPDLVKKYGDKEVKENFVPIDERDIEHATDVPVKERKIEEVEIIDDERVKKIIEIAEKRKKKAKKIKNRYWTEEFKILGNKKLKEDGPILIITEKPQAAQKISEALAEGKVKKNVIGGVSYYELNRDGKEIQVACAVGHLFTIAQKKPRNKWPTFEIGWAPNFLVRKKDFTKKYYMVIAKLCKKASAIIVATDYDIEGEVIGMNIVRYICNQKDAERMKFSTLTNEEIKKSYENKSKSLDWKQGIAGETRHYLDWIYGINLSRALMDAVKNAGSFRLMSIGRVQGPALNIIVKKEKQIEKFKSEKYWQVFLLIDDKKHKLEVKYNKDITNEKELEKFEELKGQRANATMKKTQRKMPPNPPFDLTALQTEVYKFYKITPSKTLQIAQKLYLSGVISYPRTSSQKIPKEIGYEKILKKLSEKFGFSKYIKNNTPIEGKKTDPAHPSIYPTGEFNELGGDDKKVYDLIVKRFVSCFCDSALIDDKKIEVEINKLKFNAKGISIAEKAWMNVYPSLIKENQIPDIEGEVDIEKVNIEEKFTQPPNRYNPASIISELEKKNLGTKATRSSIIETLYSRGYIKEKSIVATSLGISLINTLEENCPVIIDENLTRGIEINLENIRNSKKPFEKEQAILKENEKVIYQIGEQFEKNKNKIGKDLIKATEKLWEQEKKDSEIGECIVCHKGKLTIRYAKQYKRYFVACNSYPECKTTYTLPPNGMIKKVDKLCEECGFPMLMSIRKGKRPWIFCFNPECPSREKKD